MMQLKEIFQTYLEVSGTEEIVARITKLKRPENYQSVPMEIEIMLPLWAKEFNKNLGEENWSVDYFRQYLGKLHPDLLTCLCAMERLVLLLLGLNLRKRQDGNLDFGYSVDLFRKNLVILKDLFGEEGEMASVHLKNMYNISAPGFFKNLIFKGGPKMNRRIISIKDKFTLDSHIDDFNKSFSSMGIIVSRSQIKSECIAAMNKLNNDEISNYDWLTEWMSSITD